MLDTDVLVVGAGPVGQLTALALARHGIRSLLVDRRTERSLAPRAHAVNPRTLEICDRLGVPGETLRSIGAPPAAAGWVRFTTSLTGTEFGHLPYERQQDDVLDLTPFPLSNISQPDFEAALGAALEATRAVSVLRGCACSAIDQDETGATATLTFRGIPEPMRVRCRYVVAADGAASPTRDALGIELEGLEGLGHHVMIHFEADLTEYVAARPGVLHFLFGPARSSVLICYDAARSWVLMQPYDPAVESPEDFDAARCEALVEAAVGAPVPDLVIRHRSPWTMCAQVAASYRSGRVFLVGDAAHRFPPTGGLGLNTGAADAQDIAWKLAAVLRGDAGEALLDSYEAERRPVALTNSQQSLTNSARLFELVAALNGADPAHAAEHFAAVAADPAAFPEIAAAVEAQGPHFDSLALQLGYSYDSAAIVDPAPRTEPDDIRRHEPSHAPGACLPHAWVDRNGERVSLLSLLPATSFCLLAGPDASVWAGAAERLPLPITVLREGVDYTALGDGWSERTGLPVDGALLLRPDAHVCMRLDTPKEAALEQLACGLDRVLARAA